MIQSRTQGPTGCDKKLSRKEKDVIAVIRQIFLLHDGQLEDFRPAPVPTTLRIFLRHAALHQLQGILTETLVNMRLAGWRGRAKNKIFFSRPGKQLKRTHPF